MSPMLQAWNLGLKHEFTGSQPVSALVHRAMAASSYRALCNVRCHFDKSDRLVLHGDVPSYFHRQVAHSIVQKLGIANTIVDRIEVLPQCKPR